MEKAFHDVGAHRRAGHAGERRDERVEHGASPSRRAQAFDRWTGADLSAINALKARIETYQAEHARMPTLTDVMVIEYTWTDSGVTWTLVKSGQLKKQDAGYSLTPDGAKTKVRFDMAIDLTAGRRGVAALGEAMSCWVQHMLSVAVNIEPLTEMRDVALSWYVGLDTDATEIGNALWNGEAVDDDTMARVTGLFRLAFQDARVMLDDVRGEPVYLILAMTRDKSIRIKPQNLVTGLPVKHLEAVS